MQLPAVVKFKETNFIWTRTKSFNIKVNFEANFFLLTLFLVDKAGTTALPTAGATGHRHSPEVINSQDVSQHERLSYKIITLQGASGPR